MRYTGLDTAFRLPAVRTDSSSAFRYHRASHVSAAASEATKTSPTTSAGPRCPRAAYLHGFTFREELRNRGLLGVPAAMRPRRRAAASREA